MYIKLAMFAWQIINAVLYVHDYIWNKNKFGLMLWNNHNITLNVSLPCAQLFCSLFVLPYWLFISSCSVWTHSHTNWLWQPLILKFCRSKKSWTFFLEFLIPQLLYWKLHSAEMRCCLLLLLLLVLGLHEIWDLTGLNF